MTLSEEHLENFAEAVVALIYELLGRKISTTKKTFVFKNSFAVVIYFVNMQQKCRTKRGKRKGETEIGLKK